MKSVLSIGAHCYVIAPRKLDEERTGVKTDSRDAGTLCQRLSRYVNGNTRELAVIRVPSEEEERARHSPRQREQLVRHRQKIEAQGRGLLVSHGLPAPAHWARPSAGFPSPLRLLGGKRRLGTVLSSCSPGGLFPPWRSTGQPFLLSKSASRH